MQDPVGHIVEVLYGPRRYLQVYKQIHMHLVNSTHHFRQRPHSMSPKFVRRGVKRAEPLNFEHARSRQRHRGCCPSDERVVGCPDVLTT
jgi:hypothetical protein